ncbi:probable nucleoredoxin 1 [Fagus crenata]
MEGEGVAIVDGEFQYDIKSLLLHLKETSSSGTMENSDGKLLNPNVAGAVEEHGVEACPFTLKRLAELKEAEKAKQDTQSLESILLGEGDTTVRCLEL